MMIIAVKQQIMRGYEEDKQRRSVFRRGRGRVEQWALSLILKAATQMSGTAEQNREKREK